ncbi:hypothetical protein NC652_001816 [Populus alba x Populus x berolinensis]|nr:hypothetical protein NC652_001816 [Populus alba x Populus x berolinensis]
MAQYNLVSSCLKIKTIKRLITLIRINHEIMKHLYISLEHMNDNLKDMIFENLLKKRNEDIEHLKLRTYVLNY